MIKISTVVLENDKLAAQVGDIVTVKASIGKPITGRLDKIDSNSLVLDCSRTYTSNLRKIQIMDIISITKIPIAQTEEEYLDE